MQHASVQSLPLSTPAQPAAHRLRARLAMPGAILVILGAVGVMQMYAARQHLLRGAQEAASAEAILHDPLMLRNAGRRASIRAALTRSNREFAQAQLDLFLWSPLLTHLGWVPRLGPEMSAAP